MIRRQKYTCRNTVVRYREATSSIRNTYPTRGEITSRPSCFMLFPPSKHAIRRSCRENLCAVLKKCKRRQSLLAIEASPPFLSRFPKRVAQNLTHESKELEQQQHNQPCPQPFHAVQSTHLRCFLSCFLASVGFEDRRSVMYVVKTAPAGTTLLARP